MFALSKRIIDRIEHVTILCNPYRAYCTALCNTRYKIKKVIILYVKEKYELYNSLKIFT